jgi:hypothetical protein
MCTHTHVEIVYANTWVRVLDFCCSSTGFFFLSCALARSSADRANCDHDHNLMSEAVCVRVGGIWLYHAGVPERGFGQVARGPTLGIRLR